MFQYLTIFSSNVLNLNPKPQIRKPQIAYPKLQATTFKTPTSNPNLKPQPQTPTDYLLLVNVVLESRVLCSGLWFVVCGLWFVVYRGVSVLFKYRLT
jgi:hypothetical protein